MQQSQKPAAKTEAEGPGHLRLVVQRRVVEAQFGERVAEFLVILRVDREQPGKHPRLDLLEPGERCRRRPVLQRDGVADGRAVDLLDACDHEAHIAGGELPFHHRLGRKAPEPVDQVAAAGGHHADPVAALEAAVHHPHQRHDADVIVEPRVDDQRLQRRIQRAAGRGNAPDEGLQKLRHPLAGLGAHPRRIGGLDADDLLDFAGHTVGIGRGQVDLVDDRQHLQALFGGGVAVGDTLRLDTLGRIHHQQCPVAGGQRARHLVGEIHVPRRVDHVQLIALAVTRAVVERDALRLDRDPAFALQLHRVEHLRLHFAVGEAAAQLDEPVSEGRFAVVNVRDDGKVTYVPHESGRYCRMLPRPKAQAAGGL